MLRNPEITSPDQVEVSFYLADEEDDSKAYMNSERTQADLVTMIDKMRRIKEGIENGVFKRHFTPSCRYCEYLELCNSERNQIVRYETVPIDESIQLIVPPRPKKPREASQLKFDFMKRPKKSPERVLEEMLATTKI